MKAKELMIDDWVLVNGKITQIVWVGNIHKMAVRGFPYEFMDGEIEPIPIKRIHLTKNGFKATNAEDTEFVYRDGYEIKVMIEEDLADAIFLSIEFAERNIWKEIKYVHELQQAMRLMGCEQEIRL